MPVSVPPPCTFRAATRCFCESAPSHIERNLKTSKRSLFRPTRRCRNRTGPGESSFIASAHAASTGDSTTTATTPATRSNARLRRSAEWPSTGRGTVSSGIPSSLMKLEPRADSVRPAGDKVDVDSKIPELTDERGTPQGLAQRRGEHHAVDSQLSYEGNQLSVVRRHVRRGGGTPEAPRPDLVDRNLHMCGRPDPPFRMPLDLADDRGGLIRRADDQRVLQIPGLTARKGTRDRAEPGQKHHG